MKFDWQRDVTPSVAASRAEHTRASSRSASADRQPSYVMGDKSYLVFFLYQFLPRAKKSVFWPPQSLWTFLEATQFMANVETNARLGYINVACSKN